MRSPNPSRSYCSQRTRPAMPSSARLSIVFTVYSSIDGGEIGADLAELGEWRHLDVAQARAHHRGAGLLCSGAQRGSEAGEIIAVPREEPGEHRGEARADVRAAERVVAGVAPEQDALADETHAMSTVVEDDVGDRQIVLDRGVDLEAVHEECAVTGDDRTAATGRIRGSDRRTERPAHTRHAHREQPARITA